MSSRSLNWRGLRVATILTMLAATFTVIPAIAASASTPTVSSTAPTSVNLADYALIARYQLPSKENPLGGDTTCASSGSGDELGDEASAVTFDPLGNSGAGSLFVLGDGGACVVQVTLTGTYIDSMTLALGNSAQGTAFFDTEGITYVGQDNGKPQLVITEERYRNLDEFDYTPSTTLALTSATAVKLGTTIGNIGLEGVSFDPATSNGTNCATQTVNTVTGNYCQGFIVVKEKQPEDIFQTNVNWGSRGTASTDIPTGTATNGSATENEGTSSAPTSLFTPTLAGLNDMADVFALSNIPSLDGNSGSDLITGSDGTKYDGDILIDSQESGSIEQVNRSGAILSRLDLWPNPSSGLDVIDETHEGVTMDDNGNLYVDSEDGAGPGDPELEVYAPTTTPDLAPTAITLAASTDTLPSNTTTTNGPVKLSGLSITDADYVGELNGIGFGQDTYTVTATDGASTNVSADFKADHTGLYLASGASLTGVVSPVTLTVNVTDTGASNYGSNTAGVTSSPFVLTVKAVTPITGAESKIIISEVDPSGSTASNNTYAEDWFELTNTGTQPVSLAGWSADDSHEVAGKCPLFGVASIAPGESVVFVQADTSVTPTVTPAATVAAFKAAWGLGASTQVGYYSNADGLSTGGDEVNVYDSGENLVAGVSFGAAESKVSFDNSAGIDGTIGTFTDPGDYTGAITDTEGETGSPGYANIAPTVAVTEVDPNGSGEQLGSDWFELTNYGINSVNLSGWTMDDNSELLADSVDMTTGSGSSILAPGASIIFAEDPADSSVSSGTEALGTLNADLAAIETKFEANWFPSGTPSGFQFGVYGGKSVGLSTSGDGVTIFNASGVTVDEVLFSGTGIFQNPGLVGVGAPSGSAPLLTTIGVVGVAGAYTDTVTADTTEVGSPGVYVPTLTLTEVDPAGSSASYVSTGVGFDWFEVTNPSAVAISLSGWTIDDSSNALVTSVDMTMGSAAPILPAGASIVFAEDPADSSVVSGSESIATLNTDLPTMETEFDAAWFPGGVAPANFLFGVYGGKGVGLSTSGDGVNLFNPSGTHVVGVTFGAVTVTGATFDNTTGTPVASVLGVKGARTSVTTNEVGSPGTITPDTTAPTLAISGNLGTYAWGDTVDVTCTATDDTYGSGIATPCTGIDALASTFGAGPQSINMTATDHAGNTISVPVQFFVDAATAPSITSANATTFTEGSAGTFTVTTVESPNATITEDGDLPDGVTLTDNGDGTATLAGTPTETGAFDITINAVNGTTPDGSQSFTLTVTAAPTITSDDSTTFVVGTSGSFTVTTDGSPTPAITETGDLPAGVTLTDNNDGTATLAGTPTETGTFDITIHAANGNSSDGSQSFTLTVNAAPTVTSADATIMTEGSAGTFTVTTDGSPTPAITETGALPSGVTLTDNNDGTATLAGTPSVSGSFPITINAVNGTTPDGSQSFTLVVNAPYVAPPTGGSGTGTTGTNAPPPAGVPSTDLGTPTTATLPTPTAGSTAPTTIASTVTTADGDTATASVSVPSGALPAGTKVSTYPITNATALAAEVPAGQSYVLGFSVTWQAPDGTVPAASAPITLTVSDPGIKAGDVIYEVSASGALTAVGVATADNVATITFTNDPTFVVVSLSQQTVSIGETAKVGTTLSLNATATSGQAVTYALASGSTGCALNGSTVDFTAVGTCSIIATQAGGTSYYAASTTLAIAVTLPAKPAAVTVKFSGTSATLSAGTKAQLRALAAKLVSGASVTLTGFAKGNAKLATARAKAVKAFLATLGKSLDVKLVAKTNVKSNATTVVTTQQ